MQIMKNNHGTGYSNIIDILNTLKDLDEEQLELYTKYDELLKKKVTIELCTIGLLILKRLKEI